MSHHELRGAAVITGASAGIGATYAEKLARRGHDLILVARDGARLEASAARLRAESGVKIEVFPADLTATADLTRLAARLEADPAIGVLLNNAGAGLFADFVDSDPDRIGHLIQLNVVAVTILAHAAARAFAARGAGTIINVGSIIGLRPEHRATAYGATKAYILYLSQAMDVELAARGVRVQAVLPGATRTEIFERSGRDVQDLDPARLMEVGELVDAALAGLDNGEVVTIPSLPDPADWEAFQAARLRMAPNLSRNHPAARYLVKQRV